jgi:hypothetical protein
MVAIIVVVVVVALIGSEYPRRVYPRSIANPVVVGSSVLFYVAKKREWKVRETLRRSTRKVVAALTPRRSEFPRSVKESSGGRSRGGRMKLDEVPPTPRLKPEDLEKGLGPVPLDKKKRANFSRKG